MDIPERLRDSGAYLSSKTGFCSCLPLSPVYARLHTLYVEIAIHGPIHLYLSITVNSVRKRLFFLEYILQVVVLFLIIQY